MNDYRFTPRGFAMLCAALFALLLGASEAKAAECTVELSADDHQQLITAAIEDLSAKSAN